MPEDTVSFFAVRNREGKWYRARGFGGSGDSWVDTFGHARIYHSAASARRVVGFWYKNYPEYGIPEIVRFTATVAEVLDEAARIAEKEATEERRAQNREVNRAKRKISKLKKEQKEAEKKLAEMQKNAPTSRSNR